MTMVIAVLAVELAACLIAIGCVVAGIAGNFRRAREWRERKATPGIS